MSPHTIISAFSHEVFLGLMQCVPLSLESSLYILQCSYFLYSSKSIFPYRCDLCEYVTADHNSMRRHRMRHTGDKPYQCPHCTYACIQVGMSTRSLSFSPIHIYNIDERFCSMFTLAMYISLLCFCSS